MQGRKAPAMCRRRHFRLRPRLGNLQRREGPTISPRKRESGNSKGNSKSTKEAILTGLRFFREARRRVNDNIGCYEKLNEKYRTYIRGGARDIKMAEASRRFAAGERATASRIRTEHRGDTRQQEDHEVCRRDSPQELIDKAKLKGNTKIPKSNETLSSPHDQRRQWGGGRREGGGSRGASRPEVYRVVLNVSVGIPTPGRRR